MIGLRRVRAVLGHLVVVLRYQLACHISRYVPRCYPEKGLSETAKLVWIVVERPLIQPGPADYFQLSMYFQHHSAHQIVPCARSSSSLL